MPYPIDAFDMLDLVIQKEVQISQISSSLTNTSTMVLDNTGNIEASPIITLNINNGLSTLTLSNLTTGITMSLTAPSYLVSGAVLTMYNDSIYASSGSELSGTFNGVFNISENESNTLQFTLSPSTDKTIDATVQWLQPSPVEKIVTYVEGFNINESRTQKRGSVNLLNKYTDKYINQDIAYDFSIDKMYLDDYFIDDDEDETYRLSWETDSNVGNINQITTYLCGCKFNNLSWSQTENEIVKEGIRGVACRKLKG